MTSIKRFKSKVIKYYHSILFLEYCICFVWSIINGYLVIVAILTGFIKRKCMGVSPGQKMTVITRWPYGGFSLYCQRKRRLSMYLTRCANHLTCNSNIRNQSHCSEGLRTGRQVSSIT